MLGICLSLRVAVLAAGLTAWWHSSSSTIDQAPIGLGRALLIIGDADAPSEYLFARIGGAQLSGDNIVVADNGSADLRFYDSRGRFLKRVGRRGAGPGEFQSLKLVPNWHSDSIVVFDQGLHRVSFISSDGRFGRAVQVASPSAQPGLWGSFDVVGVARDGRLIVESQGGVAPKNYGSYRRNVTLRFAPSPTVRDITDVQLIGTFKGSEFLYSSGAGNPVFSLLPFLNQFVRGLGPDRLYYVEGPASTLVEQFLTIAGRTEHAIPFRSKPVTRQEYESWFERELTTVPEDRRPPTRVFYRNLYAPWMARPVAKIHVDNRGRIWVEEYSLGARRRVAVYASDFRALGQFEVPANFDILTIRGDRLIGASTDTDGVQRVEIRPVSGL